MNNSKDGPTFGQFGKSVEKVQKTWDFHEIIAKCPKLETFFECLSLIVLKVTITLGDLYKVWYH